MRIIEFIRKFACCNKIENFELTKEFLKRKIELKNYNYTHVLNGYYMPLAVREFLATQRYLKPKDDNEILNIALANLHADRANGVLNEFYQFIES